MYINISARNSVHRWKTLYLSGLRDILAYNSLTALKPVSISHASKLRTAPKSTMLSHRSAGDDRHHMELTSPAPHLDGRRATFGSSP